jgi:outer membrane protein TolC
MITTKEKLLPQGTLARSCALSIIVFVSSVMPVGSYAATPALDDLPVIVVRLSLADALRLVDQDNIQIAQAQDDSDSANASAAKMNSALQPSVSATTYGTTGSESSIFTSSSGVEPQNIFALPRKAFADQDVTVMFPLTSGGMLQNRAKSAVRSAHAVLFDFSARRLAAQDSVSQAYINVLLQQALLTSAQSTLTAEQEQVRITQAKVGTGELAPLDLLREQAALADAQSAATQSQTSVDLAEVDMNTVLGVSQMSNITLTDSLNSLESDSPTILQEPLADAIHLAEKNRPELAAANERLIAARAGVSAVHGEYAPQVYVVGMADAMINQGSSDQAGYTVGLTASIPLYDGGDRRADADSATAVLARVQADKRSTEEQIERGVSQAWFQYAASGDQIASAQAGFTAAQQGYELANLRYNSGKSTTVDRLDALAALTHARSDLSMAIATKIDDRVNLLVAMGLSELTQPSP